MNDYIEYYVYLTNFISYALGLYGYQLYKIKWGYYFIKVYDLNSV